MDFNLTIIPICQDYPLMMNIFITMLGGSRSPNIQVWIAHHSYNRYRIPVEKNREWGVSTLFITMSLNGVYEQS